MVYWLRATNGEYQTHNCCANKFKNVPTSVTTPRVCCEPRSESFVTTAGLMSTQTIRTHDGVILPAPIEWSIDDKQTTILAPSSSRAYSSCASIKSIWVSGKGPSSRIEPASTKGTFFLTASYIMPERRTPASTAPRIEP